MEEDRDFLPLFDFVFWGCRFCISGGRFFVGGWAVVDASYPAWSSGDGDGDGGRAESIVVGVWGSLRRYSTRF